MHTLCLNAGSSSIKFAVYGGQGDDLTRQLRGAIDGIGQEHGRAWLKDADGRMLEDASGEFPDHAAGIRVLLDQFHERVRHVDAIGHRVVHGGRELTQPTVVDDQVLEELRDVAPFAPLHVPHQIAVIEAVRQQYPNLPQVTCFDTAFHRRMPVLARRFPLPDEYWQRGLEKYGFHGLSYEYITRRHPEAVGGRSIIAHLGNGASLAAVRDGEPVETTMGFTPTGGIVMSTRTGDIDPGVLLYLMRTENLAADDVDRLVNRSAGLLGVSGLSSDMQTLLEAEENASARLAVELFCYHARRHIGALAAVLGGLDQIVFTAGIGEHAAEIRRRICVELGWLGVEFDEERNAGHAPIITRDGSRCRVHVIPTNEEWMIARHVGELVRLEA